MLVGIALALLAGIVLANVTDATATPSLRVKFTLVMRPAPDGIDLSGASNLPDGTRLELDVASKRYVQLPPGVPKPASVYYAQGETVVRHGRFGPVRFSDDHRALAAATTAPSSTTTPGGLQNT